MDGYTNMANVGEARSEQESKRGTGVHWSEKQRESSDPNNDANKVRGDNRCEQSIGDSIDVIKILTF